MFYLLKNRKFTLFIIIWLIAYLFFRYYSITTGHISELDTTKSSELLIVQLVFLPIKLFIELFLFGFPSLIPTIGLYVVIVSSRNLFYVSSKNERDKYVKRILIFLGVLIIGIFMLANWQFGSSSPECLPYGGIGGGPTC